MEVTKLFLRYTLPFAFSMQKSFSGEESIGYEEISRQIENRFFLDRNKEQVAYWQREYLKDYGECDLYQHIQDLAEGEHAVSSRWKTTPKKGKKTLFLEWKGTRHQFSIGGAGLALFRSGIGFLSLDISISEKNPEMLCKLSGLLKEINYEHNITEKKGKEEYVPFSYRDFILDHLEGIPVTTYFMNRYRENHKMFPDKFTIFSWMNATGEREDLFRINRLLARGYSASYLLTKGKEVELFENITWSADREGAGGVTIAGGEFFQTGFSNRLETYYYLYMLCLHEYYYHLYLSQAIASLVEEKESKKLKKLEELEKFLTKLKMKTSYYQVSQISHHNIYYHYLREILELDTIQKELEEKISALKENCEILLEKRKQGRLLYFTLVSGMFVVVQTFSNVLGMYDSFQFGIQNRLLFSIVFMALCIFICFFIWGVWLWFRRDKKEK